METIISTDTHLADYVNHLLDHFSCSSFSTIITSIWKSCFQETGLVWRHLGHLGTKCIQSHCFLVSYVKLCGVAGQIGLKPNRSQSNRPQIKSLYYYVFFYLMCFTLFFLTIFKYIQYVLIIEELKLSNKYSCVLYQ